MFSTATSKNSSFVLGTSKRSSNNVIFSFRPPVLREGKDAWYIEYYAFDPACGLLRRKRTKVNRTKGTLKARRAYAMQAVAQLTAMLQRGWNPWIDQQEENLALMGEALAGYESYIMKMYNSGYYRKETYAGYKSYLRNLTGYIEDNPIYYVYQFDKAYIADFLDEIFIGRDNSAQTHNNYLLWLGLFSSWLVKKGYLAHKPTDGLQPISKRFIKKKRAVIPQERVAELADWCKTNDPHFLLCCYLLYYCHIRPIEQTRLHVRDFDVKSCTLTIHGDDSKNHKTQVVTLPKKVLLYAVELGVFNHAGSDYLFGDKLHPGKVPTTDRVFRGHWDKLRTKLNFKKEWQLYSLKDTGITEMLEKNLPSIAVRDQARHSSLAITEIYTAHTNKANKNIIDYDGSL